MPQKPPDTVVALDIGERRIGVAVAQLLTRLPSPQGAIINDAKAIDNIVELLEQQAAVALVIGLPRSLDGNDTAQTRSVRAFAEKLKTVTKLPVHFQDEALTSKQAEQELASRQVRYNKETVDALAATYILTDFLAEHRELQA